MVLRPKAFNKHDNHYIIRYTQPGPASASGEYLCWRVPQHLRAQHWLALLRQHRTELAREQLVLLPSSCQVLAVLGKLEERQFIHCYANNSDSNNAIAGSSVGSTDSSGRSSSSMLRSHSLTMPWQLLLRLVHHVLFINISTSSSASSVTSSEAGSDMSLDNAAAADSSSRQQAGTAGPEMLLELPRFGLEFVLQGGRLLSCNYSGYRLRQRQMLVAEHQPDGDGDCSSPDGSPACAGSSCSVHYTLPDFQQYLVLERMPGVEAQGARAGSGACGACAAQPAQCGRPGVCGGGQRL